MVYKVLTVLAVAGACLAAAPGGLAANITLTPEADTFVRASDPAVAHGLETSFDVHGGASSYNCGTGPAVGLLRFDLSSIPAGATITGATLQLTSFTGFAFDGDPVHHASFIPDDSWAEGSVTWNTRPADGLVPQAPPAEWLLFGSPLSTSPANLGAASAFDNVGCFGTTSTSRAFTSPNLATRVGAERAGDGKLSVEVFTIACGTPFAVVCQNGQLEQSYFLRYYSKEQSLLTAPRLSVDYTTLATPSLIRVVSTGGTGAFVIGRVDGAASLPLTVAASTASTCTAGALPGGGTPAGGPVSVTTDAAGYFSAAISGVTPGDFVAVRVTAPFATGDSPCLASSGDNDFWPKALAVTGSSATARDFVDSPGKARWYKFAVTPGQRIQVGLSGLPADYDLAVFKDIGQAFAAQLLPADADALTKLSAEYAPSVFSPSVFSPSVFSPSVFSPDAYSPSVFSPSVFSPSVFSPSVFSPSVFSPSVFSPSVFSPSVFSPSVFSPSVFSPSVFSPSVFSPSVFSPDEIARAFSSAQTRSIIGVSATLGTGDESVVVNSWNNTGSFYVRVGSKGGAFDTASQFTVTVSKGATTCAGVTDTTLTPRTAAPGTGLATVILTDSSKLALGTALPGGGTLGSKLDSFAARAEIDGIVVDVAGDPRVAALKQQAAANPACPFAQNLVAEEIKGIVDSYRPANPGLRYVVIAGGDNVIPFFRYPDQSLLGQESGYVPPVTSDSPSEASLRNDFVLSQDAYGAETLISLRTSAFPVPGLAVGRLVETPSEVAGLLDAYTLAGGVVAPGSSLVTGYDFLADAAGAVQTELEAGTGATADQLVTPANKSPQDPASWTAAQLSTKLLGSRHDVIFLAGHFSANSALAADFSTNLLTTDLVASPVDLVNSVVFSAGCHAGYNLVDGDAVTGVTQALDWAQAFARKRATLIAGTGYQYGDTDFLEYSERLYRDFARQLRAGTGAVSVGEALVRAKLDYLATTPDLRGLHEKALLETAVFGLPMLGVNMPAGRGSPPASGGVITPALVAPGPAATLGLRTFDLAVAPGLTTNTATLTNVQNNSQLTATWLSGPNGVVSNPAEPALPLAVLNVTPTDSSIVLRGVGFRGGTFTDSTVVPLTGAPTTELRGVHAPFVSPVFFPMRLSSVSYFGALGGSGGTNLLVTPAQHRLADAALGTSALRKYSSLDLRLFYSGNLTSAALSDAPTIVSIDAQPASGGVDFAAQVIGDPAAAIQSVWVTHVGGAGTWAPLDLAQCVAPLPVACGAQEDSRLWKGHLAVAPADLQFVVQAANGLGLVSLDDNRGSYYRLAGPAQAATTLTLVSPPGNGTFGDSPSVTAALTQTVGGTAISGRTVTIAIGGSAAVGTTGADGRVTLHVPLVTAPGSHQLVASFGGDATLLPSSDSEPFSIAKAPASLSAFTQLPVVTGGGATGIVSTLTAAVGGKQQPLLQLTVTYSLVGPGGTKSFSTITDYLGRATLPPTGLGPGTYTVTASFAGDVTYTPATRTGTLVVSSFTGFFQPVDNPPTVNIVNAGRAIPVKFSLGGNRGLAIFAPGYPRVVTTTCGSGGPTDEIETTVTADSSGLQYDASSGQYTYTWKTQKTWVGCRRLELLFVDGSLRVADFKFK
jgi:hypothetical protein